MDPLLDAINSAKKSLDIAIFRFDLKDIEKAAEEVKRLQDIFDGDWARTDIGKKEQKEFVKEQKLAAADDVVSVASSRS